jgi:hypothetical protein
VRTPSPVRLRRTILPACSAIFLTGLIASTAAFFRGRPFDPRAALLSDLASPQSNPRGHLVFVAAVILTVLLFIPAASVFHRSAEGSRLAPIATTAFSLGIGAAILIAVLAPITTNDSTLHVQLAFAAFTGILLGTTLYLIATRASRVVIGIQFALLLFLVWEYFGPDLLTGTHLVNSLAFCEWALCLDCAIALWVLAAAVGRERRAQGKSAL